MSSVFIKIAKFPRHYWPPAAGNSVPKALTMLLSPTSQPFTLTEDMDT